MGDWHTAGLFHPQSKVVCYQTEEEPQMCAHCPRGISAAWSCSQWLWILIWWSSLPAEWLNECGRPIICIKYNLNDGNITSWSRSDAFDHINCSGRHVMCVCFGIHAIQAPLNFSVFISSLLTSSWWQLLTILNRWWHSFSLNCIAWT